MSKLTLKDVCLKITDGEHNTVIDDINGEYFLLSSKNIKNGQIIINDRDRRVNEDTIYALRKRTCMAPGDIAISTIGTIGESAIVPEKIDFEFQRSVGILKPNLEIITSDYLYYYTKTILFKRLVKKQTTGSVQACLFIGGMEKIPIRKISLDEQNAIVSMIKPFDKKIECNYHLINALNEYSQLLFHKWFVDFNFPNENGEPYKYSGGEMVEIDGKMIPKSWQDIPLIDVAFFINGLAMQKFPPKNELDMLPVIKIKEINNNGYGKETEYVTKTIDKDLVVNDGDILFPWSGSLSVNIWTGGVGGLNQHIFKVKSDEFDKWYIYLWLKNHMRFFEKIAYGKKTTMGHINRKHLGFVNVLVPEKHTLKVMNDLMNPIFNKIVSLNIENRKLTEYRDLLINKLVK